MNVRFSSIHAPNSASSSFMEKVDFDSSKCFKKYDKKILIPPNTNYKKNIDHETYDEPFFKKKYMPSNKHQEKWTDDILTENFLPKYDYDHKPVDLKKKIPFDISSITNNKDHFNKYQCKKFNFEEGSNSNNQTILNNEDMTEIEPILIDKKQNLLKLKPTHDIKTNENFLTFDLKKEDLTSFKKSTTATIDNEELLVTPQIDLNNLTPDMFIHNEIDRNNIKNKFIDSTPQSQSYYDSFIQKMKVSILKFDCKPTFFFDTFSQEWSKDLNISTKDFNENINDIFISHFETLKPNYDIFKNANEIQVSVNGDITEVFSPIISKSLKNERSLINYNNPKISEMIETIKNEYTEKELSTEAIPSIVHINKLFFSEDDISQFGNFFQNLKFIGVEFKESILFTINTKIANILIIDDNFDSMISKIVEILGIFSQVIITTIIKPCICLPQKIKWRYITSHSQIAAAILPFLIEENLITKKDSTDDNKP